MAEKQTPLALQAFDAFSIPTGSDSANVEADVTNNPNGYKFCTLWSGAGGTIKVTTIQGTDITFTNIPAGYTLPVVVKRVWATPALPAGVIGLVGKF